MVDVKEAAKNVAKITAVSLLFGAGAVFGGLEGVVLGPSMAGLFLADTVIDKINGKRQEKQQEEVSLETNLRWRSLAFIAGFLLGIIALPILVGYEMYEFGKTFAEFGKTKLTSVESVKSLSLANEGHSNSDNVPEQPSMPFRY